MTDFRVLEVALPILFLVLSALAKKLGRGPGFKLEEDLSFGVELTIATISSIFLEIIEVGKKMNLVSLPNKQAMANAIIEYGAFGVFMLVVFSAQVAILQEQKNKNLSLRRRRWVLLFGANITGLALFLYFLLGLRKEWPC